MVDMIKCASSHLKVPVGRYKQVIARPAAIWQQASSATWHGPGAQLQHIKQQLVSKLLLLVVDACL